MSLRVMYPCELPNIELEALNPEVLAAAAAARLLLHERLPGIFASHAVMDFLDSQLMQHFASAVFQRSLQVGPIS